MSSRSSHMTAKGQLVRFLGTSRYELPWATLFVSSTTHPLCPRLGKFSCALRLSGPRFPFVVTLHQSPHWMSFVNIPTTAPSFRDLQGTTLLTPKSSARSSR